MGSQRKAMKNEHGTHIGTSDFLQELDRDQLYAAVDMAQARIKKIESGEKVRLISVGTDWINYRHFPIDRYEDAVNLLAKTAIADFRKDGSVEKLRLDIVSMYKDEATEMLASWETDE
jgi:hypothetical protein